MDHGPPSNRRPWTMVYFEKRWWTMVWWTMVFSWTTVWWTMVLVDDGFGERWFWWTMVLVDAGFGERWFAAFKIIKNIKDFQESVHEFSKIFACGGQLSGGLFFILCTGSSLVTFLLPICKLCDHLLSTVENPLYF